MDGVVDEQRILRVGGNAAELGRRARRLVVMEVDLSPGPSKALKTGLYRGRSPDHGPKEHKNVVPGIDGTVAKA